MFEYLLPGAGGTMRTRLLDRAAAGRSAKQVADNLEAFLVGRLAAVGPADPRIAFLRRNPGDNCVPAGLRLDQLAAHVGLSERTLRRRCLDVFGYGFETLTACFASSGSSGLRFGPKSTTWPTWPTAQATQTRRT